MNSFYSVPSKERANIALYQHVSECKHQFKNQWPSYFNCLPTKAKTKRNNNKKKKINSTVLFLSQPRCTINKQGLPINLHVIKALFHAKSWKRIYKQPNIQNCVVCTNKEQKPRNNLNILRPSKYRKENPFQDFQVLWNNISASFLMVAFYWNPFNSI